MSRPFRCLLTAVAAFALVGTTAHPGEKGEDVANPFYKFWSGFKPGSTAVHLERTKMSGVDKGQLPDGIDEKRIAYKLIEVDGKRAVVEMVVTDKDFLGFVQSAPTRYIYPATVKKG